MQKIYDLPKNISWHKRFKKYEIKIRRNGKVVFSRSAKTLDDAISIRDKALAGLPPYVRTSKGSGRTKLACDRCGSVDFRVHGLCESCRESDKQVRKLSKKAKQDARNSCPICGKVLARRKARMVGKPCQKCAKKDPRRSCTRCGDVFLPRSRTEKRCANCKPSKLALMTSSRFRVLNRHLLCKCGNFFSTEGNKKRCPDCSSAQTKIYLRECPACSVQFFARLRHRYCVKHRGRNIKAFGQSGWPTVREQIIDRDGCTCQYCEAEITGRVTVDHMIALARDSNQSPIDPSNLVVACLQCNGAKQDKTPLEFFEYKHSTIGGIDANV